MGFIIEPLELPNGKQIRVIKLFSRTLSFQLSITQQRGIMEMTLALDLGAGRLYSRNLASLTLSLVICTMGVVITPSNY